MKIAVLGATGRVGRHIVSTALSDGHEVTAVVRDASRLPIDHEALRVVVADPLEAEALAEPLDGADAVVSGIGPVGRGDTLRPASRSTEAAAKVMPSCGVSRILTISAAPLNHSCEGQPFLLSHVASPLLTRILPAVYADLEAMEAVLRLGDLDWTAVRPPRLTDRRPRGRYRYDLEVGPRGTSISRADLARAMLDFLAVPETVGHAVGVSW